MRSSEVGFSCNVPPRAVAMERVLPAAPHTTTPICAAPETRPADVPPTLRNTVAFRTAITARTAEPPTIIPSDRSLVLSSTPRITNHEVQAMNLPLQMRAVFRGRGRFSRLPLDGWYESVRPSDGPSCDCRRCPDCPTCCYLNCSCDTDQMKCTCGGSECACCSQSGSCICTGNMPGCGS